jgi:cytochrome c peroxidase
MGAGEATLDAKAAELAAVPGYKKLFVAAFGDKTQIKADQVAAAISEYLRTLVCTDTAYDRLAAGEKAALTDQQKRGLDVFAGKGGCVTCHSPPYFTTAMGVAGGAYFNVGIGTRVPDDQVDIGRAKVTSDPRDWAAFKPPSLRNVTRSAPYFHDGSVPTLEAAVRLMASGGIANKNLNPALVDRQLSDAELADVIAFLASLECPGTLVAPTVP